MITDLTLHITSDCPLLDWAQSQSNPFIAMGHIGTHLDTYEKHSVPLEYFKSREVLFDVRNRDEVQLRDIDTSLVKKGDFVLFRTGRIEEFEYGTVGYFENHPQLSQELIQALVSKQIRFIGVDCPGIRRHEDHEAADRYCERNDVWVIENLHNLHQIMAEYPEIYTMWLDSDEMTGLKCRVLAVTE